MVKDIIYYKLQEYMKNRDYFTFISKLPNDIYFDDNFDLYEEYFRELNYFEDQIDEYDEEKIMKSCNKILSILLKLVKIKERKYD